jgi:hypothetical protein
VPFRIFAPAPSCFSALVKANPGQPRMLTDSREGGLTEGRNFVKKGKSPPKRAELYGRLDLEHVGSFSALNVIASWLPSSPSRGGVLVTGMEVGYTQPIRRVYELGPVPISTASFYIAGRAKGEWQAAQVLAPFQLSLDFYRTYTPPCPQAPALTCEDQGDRTGKECSVPQAWTLSCVEVSVVLLDTAARGFALQDQVQGLFDGLEVTKTR